MAIHEFFLAAGVLAQNCPNFPKFSEFFSSDNLLKFKESSDLSVYHLYPIFRCVLTSRSEVL